MQFQTEEKDGIHYITCPKVIDGKMAKELEVTIKTWLVNAAGFHILDFKNCTSLDPLAFRPFVLFNQALKANGKGLFSMNVPDGIGKEIRANGLTTVFNVVRSLEEAKRKMRPPGDRPAIDVELINPFIIGTKTVLETQANTALKPLKPYLKKAGDQLPTEVAGILNLNCDEFKGSIVLCFTAKVFLTIYENMVGEKHETIDSEVEDAAAELLNIIFGQAKTILNDSKGYNLDKALPTVLAGDRLKIHYQGRLPAIVLPFESQAGPFHIEVHVDPVGT